MSPRKARPRRNSNRKEEQRSTFFNRSQTSENSFFSPSSPVQTKLEIGKPGDPFEQEADAVADSIVNKPTQSPTQQTGNQSVHRQAKEDAAQTKLQKMEEEPQTKLQMMEEEPQAKLQMMEEEPQTKLQMMEEEPQAKLQKMEEEPQAKLQRMEEEPQAKLQMMEEEPQAKLQMMEEEEPAQAKEQSDGSRSQAHQPPGLAEKIQETRGGGNPLPEQARAEMEAHFGRDFSAVRIHTDDSAIAMNENLKSQAFAQGNDLYFNQNTFDPNSKEGKHLLAHELTHVVQQKKAKHKKSPPQAASPQTKSSQ